MGGQNVNFGGHKHGKRKATRRERGGKKPHTKRDSRRREVHKDVSGLGEEEIRGTATLAGMALVDLLFPGCGPRMQRNIVY